MPTQVAVVVTAYLRHTPTHEVVLDVDVRSDHVALRGAREEP